MHFWGGKDGGPGVIMAHRDFNQLSIETRVLCHEKNLHHTCSYSFYFENEPEAHINHTMFGR